MKALFQHIYSENIHKKSLSEVTFYSPIDNDKIIGKGKRYLIYDVLLKLITHYYPGWKDNVYFTFISESKIFPIFLSSLVLESLILVSAVESDYFNN